MKKIDYKEKVKELHLTNFLRAEDGSTDTLLSDVFIDNNSLPELSIDEVRLEKKFFSSFLHKCDDWRHRKGA